MAESNLSKEELEYLIPKIKNAIDHINEILSKSKNDLIDSNVRTYSEKVPPNIKEYLNQLLNDKYESLKNDMANELKMLSSIFTKLYLQKFNKIQDD